MKKITKDVEHKIIFGVCSGLSLYSKIDVSLLRFLFIFGAFFTGSLLLWVYLLLAILLPKK